MIKFLIFFVSFSAVLFSKNDLAQVLGACIALYLVADTFDDTRKAPIRRKKQELEQVIEVNSTMGPEFPTLDLVDGHLHFLEKGADVIVYEWSAAKSEWVNYDLAQ